jgi:hypothetical protein
MYYEVSYKGKEVIKESALDIQMDNQLSEKAMALKIDQHQDWCENLEIKDVKTLTHDTTWKPVNGERSRDKGSLQRNRCHAGKGR